MAKKKQQSLATNQQSEIVLTEKVLYWKSPTFIKGIGTVRGEAYKVDVELFDERTKDIPGFRRENYLSEEPPLYSKPRKKLA